MSGPKFHSEMETLRIQEADAFLRSMTPAPPTESIEYRPLICIEIARCVKGPPGWMGLFSVNQVDLSGKRPVRKQIVEGRDIGMAVAAIETAVRARVFK